MGGEEGGAMGGGNRFFVGLGVVLGLLVPGSAAAAGDVYKWCVDATNSVPTPGCSSPAPCDNATAFATIAEALQAAANSPDVTPGVRPSTQEVCVATAGVHVEDVVVDNSTGVYGESFTLYFNEDVAPTWCSASGAGMVFTGNGIPSSVFSVANLWWDEGLCAAGDGSSLISVSGAQAQMGGHRVLGGHGPYLEVTNNIPDGASLYKVRVEGRAGPAVVTTTQVAINESEFSSNSPPAGTSLIESSATYSVSLYQSILLGNVVSGAPLIALQSGGDLRSTVLAANVVVGDEPLVRTERPPGGESTRFSIRSSVVSRNVFLASGGLATAEPVATGRIPDPGHILSFCLPEASDNLWPGGRPVPSWTGSLGSGALFELADDGLSTGRFGVDLEGSFVVTNQMGPQGAVFRGTGNSQNISWTLIHNTVEHGSGLLLEHAGSGGGAFYSARNLVLSDIQVGDVTALTAFEATMDQGLSSLSTFYNELVTLGGTVGPRPDLVDWSDGTSYRPPMDVEGLPDCQRGQLLCPELACPPQDPSPREFFCALDDAVAYLPTETAGPAAAAAWPWTSGFFESEPPGDQYNEPGATGWHCEERPVPYDLLNSKEGDADGFSNLVDCDNEDPNVLPSVPGADGFDGNDCWDVDEDCYECPPGSNLIDPPADDDDSTEPPADDDDSAGPPDDDDSAGDDDDDSAVVNVDDDDSGEVESDEVPTGCLGRGCGVALPIGAYLPVLLIGWVRRFRSEPELPA